MFLLVSGYRKCFGTMQFEITYSAAMTFSKWFYAALAVGWPVDAAVAEARKAIFTMPNNIEWGTPVLYMHSSDGVLFELPETGTLEDVWRLVGGVVGTTAKAIIDAIGEFLDF